MAAIPVAGRKPSLQPEGLSWQEVTVALVALGEPASEEQLATLDRLLGQFSAVNEDPRNSPHLRGTAFDRLEPLVALLARPDVARRPGDTLVLALRALKVLARRQDVRLRCTQHVLDVVAPLLEPAAGGTTGTAAGLASEAANALSNLCYEPANCSGLVRAGGVARLLRLLAAGGVGPEAHLNAAGALQTLSFQPDGRAALLKAGGAGALLRCLSNANNSSSSSGSSKNGDRTVEGGSAASNSKLQQRLAGALHNLSSCAEGIAAVRLQGGTAAMAQLLASAHPGLALAAAGALQNMSREAQARAEIRAHPDAIASLAALLIGPDTQAAVCAAGTLANLAAEEGPPGGGGAGGGTSEALTQALAGALAGGIIYHSLGAGQRTTAAAT